MSANVKDVLINLISKHAKIENPKQYLYENDELTHLGINSIDFVKFVIDLENEFDVDFEYIVANAIQFMSLKKLCVYCQQRQKKVNYDKNNV